MQLRPALFLLLPLALLAQGTERSLAGFPHQSKLAGLTLGAEYLVKTIPHAGGSILAPGYLVVEVALAPDAGGSVTVNAGQFWLEIDGGKHKRMAQSPGMVAAALKYPDWTRRSSLEVAGSIGDAGVILGRPTTVERFPGDRRPEQQRVPSTRRVPTPDRKEQSTTSPDLPEAEIALRLALPEGETRQPVSGLLYFPWEGKPSKIKSLALVYAPGASAARIKLK